VQNVICVEVALPWSVDCGKLSRVTGCDGKSYRRGITREFYADLGLAVEVDTDGLLEEYDRVRTQLNSKYGIAPLGRVLNSFAIRRELGPTRASEFIREFVQSLTKFLNYIHFAYTAFNPQKLPRTWLYPLDRKREEVPIVDFVRMIDSGYAHFCGDHYLNHTGSKLPLRLDSFSFPKTNAWGRLCNHADLRVYFKGDRCHLAISLADLLLSAIDDRTSKLWREDVERAIQQLFPRTQFKANRIDHLDDLRPLTREPLDFTPNLAHPIVFLLKELDAPGESKILEDSPLMAACCNLALQRDGSAKVFEPAYTNDAAVIRNGDILVYQGPRGRNQAKMIKGSGHDIEMFDRYYMLSRYKT
jgi:hypothetical protein